MIIKIAFIGSLLILLVNPVGRSQTAEVNITLSASGITIEELLLRLSDVSGYEFSYNPVSIPGDLRISVNFSETPLSVVLSSLEEYGIASRIMDSHIILRKKSIPKRRRAAITPSYTLSGYAMDTSSGELLIGTTIADLSTGMGTAANSYGYYSLTLDSGNYEIQASYIGYNPIVKNIHLSSNLMIDYNLEMNISELAEIVVIMDEAQRTVQKINRSEIRIGQTAIKSIPGLLGESDVIKSLQSLPGINFFSDGSTIFHVRGGDRDQNLLLIDDAPVYNPAHMLGIFSVFTPESINTIDVYKGEMPASFGGRLSSVIDVKLKEGNINNLVFSGNTGLVATTLNLEGPLFGKKTSFFLSSRRSHLKWLVPGENNVEKLYFFDHNLKFNYRINRRNRLFLSYYSGLDKLQNRESKNRSGGITWINNAGNIRWNHIYGERLFSNTSMIVSNYDYNLFTSYDLKERWNTGISLAAVKSDFSFYSSPGNSYKFGLYLATHFYSPGNYYEGYNPDPVTKGVSSRQAQESALYFSFENEVTSRLVLRYGLRLTSWNNIGAATEYRYDDSFQPVEIIDYAMGERYHTYNSAEPRISMRYFINDNSSARISFSRNSQFEFLIGNSDSPFTSLEMWLPAGPNIKPMKSSQVTAGFNITGTERRVIVDVEGFYKEMENYISYLDHAQMLFNPFVESEFRYGRGWSYGIEAMARKTEGRVYGTVSYAWTRTLIQNIDINDGKKFPARYDRPHNLSLNINYRLKPGWSITANWVYATGNPITTPTGYYYYNGYQVPFYDERNNDRLPDYHRLDLATSIKLKTRGNRFSHSLNVSLFNAYGRANPFSINFNKIINDSGALVVPTNHATAPELQSSMMYIFGVIPSVTYHFSF